MTKAGFSSARENGVTALLCVAVIVAPLGFGATGPMAGLLLQSLIMLAVTCGLMSAISFGRKARSAMMAMAVVALFAGLQLLAIPVALCAIVAPLPAELWNDAGGYFGQSFAAVSVDPHATVRTARYLAILVGLAAVIAMLTRHTGHPRPLLWSVAGSGAATWLLGICFPVTRTKGSVLLNYAELIGPIDWWLTPLKRPEQAAGFGYLYWTESVGRKFAAFEWAIGDGFGTYVVSNHFACAVYLTVPTLFSLLLAIRMKPELTWLRSAVVCGLAAGLVGTIGLLAGSRAGAMSATLTMLTFWALVETRAWLKQIAITACCGYAGIVVTFLVMFYGNLGETLNWAPEAVQLSLKPMFEDVRFSTTALAIDTFAKSWLMGTGLGTFGELYRIAAPKGSAVQWFTHNDYAQFLAETGIVGGVGLLYVIARMLRQFASFLRLANPEQRLIYAGPWAGLAGVAAHSAFDWNMHVAGNAFLTAVLAGVVLGPRFGTAAAAQRRPGGPNSAKTILAAKTLIVLSAVTCLGLSIRDTCSDLAVRGMRDALTSVRKAKREKMQPDYGPLKVAVAKARHFAGFDPRNADLAQVIGQSMLVLAGEPQPIDSANRLVAGAEDWFKRVRENKATSHGLPVMILEQPQPVSP